MTEEAVELTLVRAWKSGRERLEAAGLDSPVLDARLLLEAAAGVDRIAIVTDPYRALEPSAVAAFEGFLARRLAREPVSRILGRKGFWTLDLAVTRDVLSPRPETELIVEAVLGATEEAAPLRVLDLGVGSGAILLAILSARPNATGVGVDISEAALAVARANAETHGLVARAEFVHGGWNAGGEGPFDVIVSNPPYIPTDDISGLDPEVAQYDPWLALDGGADGLDAYRALGGEIAARLSPEGVAVLEMGAGQAEDVADVMGQAGLRPVRLIQDLAGHGRVWSLKHAARRPCGGGR